MIALALALAATPTAPCRIDRQLPVGFEKWRYREARVDYDRGAADVNGTLLDARELPAASGYGSTRFFSTGTGGTYAVAIDRDAPLTLYGDARGSDGKRLAITPYAVRGGPACTSIVAIAFYRLPAGNHYARPERLDATGARTLVTRLD